MTPTALLGFAAAIAVFGLTPGPAVAGTVARCLAGGFLAGVAFNLGVIVVDVAYLALAVYGLTAVAAVLGGFFGVLKWIGAGYLVWLGIRMWRTPAAVPEAAPASGHGGGALSGMLLALGNPKGILFYGAFLPTVIDVHAVGPIDMVWLSVIDAAVLFAVNSGYGLVAARAGRLFRTRRAVTALNRGAGTVMIGAGVLAATR